MIVKINKPYVNWGADKISDFREYDGMLGYEAIIVVGFRMILEHIPQTEQ